MTCDNRAAFGISHSCHSARYQLESRRRGLITPVKGQKELKFRFVQIVR